MIVVVPDRRQDLGERARLGAITLLARFVRGRDDAAIERRFGSVVVQRALFGGLARSFDPGAAGGFQGALVYELARPATGAPPVVWTVEVHGGDASARPGPAPDPQLTVRYRLSDFVRIAAGTIDAAVPLLQGRASFDGDLALAASLPEMFGAPSPSES
jgi:SCP-2 sterol transfer family